MAGREVRAETRDEIIIRVLAVGGTQREAASRAQVTPRTVARRLAEPAFVGREFELSALQAELERARCALLAGDAQGTRRLAARARDRFRRRSNVRWRR